MRVYHFGIGDKHGDQAKKPHVHQAFIDEAHPIFVTMIFEVGFVCC